MLLFLMAFVLIFLKIFKNVGSNFCFLVFTSEFDNDSFFFFFFFILNRAVLLIFFSSVFCFLVRFLHEFELLTKFCLSFICTAWCVMFYMHFFDLSKFLPRLCNEFAFFVFSFVLFWILICAIYLYSGNTDRNLRFPRSNLKSLFDLDSFVLGINLKWEIWILWE